MNGRGFPILPTLVMLGAALWVTRPSAAHGAEHRISCPLTLKPEEIRKPPRGWQLVIPQGEQLTISAQLTKAGMLHGAPEESGYLAPTESKGSKQGISSSWVQIWKFDQPHWFKTFVFCRYHGDGMPLQLVQPIAEDATECRLTSSTKDGVVDQMAFVCK